MTAAVAPPAVREDVGDDAGASVVAAGLATLAGSLLAVDPTGLGGAILLRPTHEAARAWAANVRLAMGAGTPLRRLPINATDDRVLGGLDLAATLATGRRVVMRGVLAETDGGILVVPLAERAMQSTVSALTEVLDCGEIRVERDGVAACHAARLTVIALDETGEAIGDVQVAPPLVDRLAFHLVLPHGRDDGWWPSAVEVAAARALLPRVEGGAAARDLCALADALGIASLRAVVLAVRTARAHAALAGRDALSAEDVEVAAQLVLAPRATRLPPPPDAPPEEAAPPEPPPAENPNEGDDPSSQSDGIPDEVLLEAVRAMLPPDVLEAAAGAARRRAQSAGRRGRESQGGERGRQLRAAPGRLDGGRKLDPVATLRTAAPWQAVRRQERRREGPGPVAAGGTLEIRRDDFRIRRYKRQSGTTTIIAVDASGSMAMQRLAEAKGAVELLLAQTYVRRDKVALVAFRGEQATLLLPPTRALARAKRLIAALPGGGGTPLASAIEVVHGAAIGALREGQDVVAVWLTDARANIARDGTPGRTRAMEDARRAAQAFRALGQTAVMIDTSPRGEAAARELAGALGGKYIPLPSAQARDVARAIRDARVEEGA